MNPSLTVTLGPEPAVNASGPIAASQKVDIIVNASPGPAMLLSMLYNGQLIAFCDDFTVTEVDDRYQGLLDLAIPRVIGVFNSFPWRSAINITLTLFDAAGETMLLTSELVINAPSGAVVPEAAPETAYNRQEIDDFLTGKADLVNGKIPSEQLPDGFDGILTDLNGGGDKWKIVVENGIPAAQKIEEIQ